MKPSGHPRPRATRATEPATDESVALNSDESFPASDPPSWTPITRVGIPEKRNAGAPATLDRQA